MGSTLRLPYPPSGDFKVTKSLPNLPPGSEVKRRTDKEVSCPITSQEFLTSQPPGIWEAMWVADSLGRRALIQEAKQVGGSGAE